MQLSDLSPLATEDDMGIYDREYYRREGPSFLATVSQHGRICKTLILINVIVFLLQVFTEQSIGASITDLFALDTEAVQRGEVWRLLSYAFLHDPNSLWHIFINMLLLWWFGTEMEDIYGPKEFLTFYLVSAVLGGIVFQLIWFMGRGPSLCLGASGAVTAVMVLFALHYPHRIIYVFFLPIPVWLLVVYQVARDLFGFLPGHSGHVAVSVHLAGAAFGFIYYKSQIRLWNFVPDFSNLSRLRSRPRLRVYREEPSRPVMVGGPPGGESNEHLEAKLDAVLEKVARHGQSSLTESEREILQRASEIYKRRRN